MTQGFHVALVVLELSVQTRLLPIASASYVLRSKASAPIPGSSLFVLFTCECVCTSVECSEFIEGTRFPRTYIAGGFELPAIY